MHVLEVLRRREGEVFDAGVIDGPRGKAEVRRIAAGHLELSFTWGEAPLPLPPLTLVMGLPRPQTARKILNEAATFGVTGLHFVATERSDPNYAASTLWSSGEWRRHVLAGAAQAFDTRIPEVTWTRSLAEAARESARGAPAPVHVTAFRDGYFHERGSGSLPNGAPPARIALDNYEANMRLGEIELESACGVCLALGPERGWGGSDRAVLRENGFRLAHLGERVLRAETAVIAALAIVATRQGRM